MSVQLWSIWRPHKSGYWKSCLGVSDSEATPPMRCLCGRQIKSSDRIGPDAFWPWCDTCWDLGVKLRLQLDTLYIDKPVLVPGHSRGRHPDPVGIPREFFRSESFDDNLAAYEEFLKHPIPKMQRFIPEEVIRRELERPVRRDRMNARRWANVYFRKHHLY